MWRLPLIAFRHGWVTAFAVLAITAIAVPTAARVRVDASADNLVAKDSPQRAAHEAALATFGSDEIAAIYAEDAALFTPDRMRRLAEINAALSRLGFVQRAESLFTLPDIRDEGGLINTSPLLATIPGDAGGLARARDRAIANPLLRGQVISADGTATVITLYLASDRAGLSPSEISRQIDAALEPHRAAFTHLFQVGKPATQSWIAGQLRSDQLRILPLSVVVLLCLLGVSLRNAVAALFPIANAAIAVAWSFAAMALLGIPVNLLNYTLPALVLVIGATSDIHVTHEFREHLARGLEPAAAVEAAARRISLALLLTSATTVLGFAATALSDLPILQDFGLAAAISMTARFVTSVVFLPACFRIALPLVRPGLAQPATEPPRWTHAVARWLVSALRARSRAIIAIIILATAAALWCARKIEVTNNLQSFLRPDAPVVERSERLASKLSGLKVLYLTLRGEPGAFAEPRELRQLAAIAEHVRGMDGVDSATAITDILGRINEQLHGADPSFNTVPPTAAATRQFLLFSQPSDYRAYLTPDFGSANIVIRCDIQDTARLNRLIAQIRADLDGLRFGPVVHSLTGSAVIVASAVDSITWAQTLSIGSMMLTLFLTVWALFLSPRCGAITVAANLIPVVFVFGIMGLAGVSLNVGTCMVAAISLGIAVDDTLHLLVHFNREARALKDERLGMEAAIRDELGPIIATSLALAGGFAALGLSSFQPVREFGLLSAGVMVLALGTELIVTPLFLSTTRIVTLWDVLGLHLRSALLQRSPFFAGLSRWQAKKVVLASDIEEHRAGETLIRAGETGDKMYVVLSGELDVSIAEGDARRVVARLNAGDIFGEMAFVSRRPRTADVTARSTTQTLALDFSSLEKLRRFSPYLASQLLMNISRILCDRLAQASAAKK